MQPTKWAFEKADEAGKVTSGIYYDALAGTDGEVRLVQAGTELTFPTQDIGMVIDALQQIKTIAPQLPEG